MFEKYPSKLFKDIIRATFPEYRKRTVCVMAKESVELHGLNWSGGTKRVYHACTIDGEPLEEKVTMDLHHPWNNPYEGLKLELPEGMIIVEGGWFCGKESTLWIYCNPVNMPKLISNK